LKVAIVSTVRRPGRALQSFLAHHFAVGVRHVFLFFEDAEDPELTTVRPDGRLSVFRCDEALRRTQQRQRLYPKVAPFLRAPDARACSSEQLTAQQMLNAETALALSREMGFDWLIHIDVDECLSTPSGDVEESFRGFSEDGAEAMVFFNHEAALERGDYGDDYFREMTLFKVNPELLSPEARRFMADGPRPGLQFLAYTQGKSAVLVSDDVLPCGAHRFVNVERPIRTMAASETVVLHYPYSNYRRFWEKHERLGTFPTDKLLVWDWRPPDLIVEAQRFVDRGDESGARRLFETTALLPPGVDVDRLIDAGVLSRITDVADRLAGTAP
jgi:hypothetical protein